MNLLQTWEKPDVGYVCLRPGAQKSGEFKDNWATQTVPGQPELPTRTLAQKIKTWMKLSMVVHACDSSTWQEDNVKFKTSMAHLGSSGQPELRDESG